MDKRGGSIKIFRGKSFVSQCQKIAGEHFSVSLIFGIEKFYASEGYVTIFCRKFFVSQCRKSSQVNTFVLFFRKFRVAKKLMDKGGWRASRFSVKNFLFHSTEKFLRGIL